MSWILVKNGCCVKITLIKYKGMLDLTRSFCSYIKHGERGKVDRRAIASAIPILTEDVSACHREFPSRARKACARINNIDGGRPEAEKNDPRVEFRLP